MSDLEKEVQSTMTRLKNAENMLQTTSINLSNVINQDNYATWIEKTQYAKQLELTLPLFALRQHSEKGLMDLLLLCQSRERETVSSIVPYCGVSMPMASARELSIDSYLVAYWSVYDRLSNIIGRVVGNASIRRNPLGKLNPKLVETFLAEKNGIDVLGMRELIFKSYGYEIGFSYLIRNCYFHEGGMISDLPILSGLSFGDAFMLSDTVAEKLNNEISSRYKIPNVVIVKPDSLVRQLKDCHSKMDNLFVSLLRFMTGTLLVEIESFAAIDGFPISE